MLVKDDKLREWEDRLREMQADVDSGDVSELSEALQKLREDVEWERTRFSRTQR